MNETKLFQRASKQSITIAPSNALTSHVNKYNHGESKKESSYSSLEQTSSALVMNKELNSYKSHLHYNLVQNRISFPHDHSTTITQTGTYIYQKDQTHCEKSPIENVLLQ